VTFRGQRNHTTFQFYTAANLTLEVTAHLSEGSLVRRVICPKSIGIGLGLGLGPLGLGLELGFEVGLGLGYG